MNREPRHRNDYSARQVQAAHHVLVDVGQVLSSFRDAIVVVGGWVPDLLLPDAEPEHVGSIDVDLARDTEKLGAGRYAELLKLLLHTGRYQKGDKDFQLVADVDLEDGEPPVRVEVEFLAPSEVKLKKNRPKLTKGFRVLQFPACAVAFQNPENVEIEGSMISGATNKVRFRVASISDFIIMKAQRWRAATSRRTCTTCVIALTRTRAGSPLSPKNGDRAWETRSRTQPCEFSERSSQALTITVPGNSQIFRTRPMPKNARCTLAARTNSCRSFCTCCRSRRVKGVSSRLFP